MRVSVQAGLEATPAGAVETLVGLKESSRVPFELVADALGASHLPAWVSGARQVSDGHLVALAEAHGLQPATLDKGIARGFLIPWGSSF